MGGEFKDDPTGMRKILAKLTSLQQQITDLRAAAKVRISTIADGGRLTIEGGRVQINDVNGNPIVIMGTMPSGSVGLFVFRPDGVTALQTYVRDGGGFAAIFDRQGNYVFTDDATSGQGIARPYISGGGWVSNNAPDRMTMSSSWVTLQTQDMMKQHPKLSCKILVQVAAATTGDVRIVDQDGTQIGDVLSFTAGQFTYQRIRGELAGTHLQGVTLNLQARVTSGMGAIAVRGVSAIGVESAAF